MKNSQVIPDIATTEREITYRFWKRAFAVYAFVEVVIITLQTFITWNLCPECLLPPGFYVLSWLRHISFTGLLWYLVNRFYHLRVWKLVLLNTLAFLAYYCLWIATSYVILHSGVNGIIWKHFPPRPLSWILYGSWADIGKFVLKLSAFYALKFYSEYKKTERQKIRLALLNKDLQLNLLKQQLNPHFYFNTLNNLYGLARINSARLSEALQQLYSIMQYVVVDCNKDQVLLSQEINFLQSYIALEKLRYEEDTLIQMKVEGEPGNKTIVPLLLIQFVENAFKHGMKEKSESNWIKVGMRISGNELLYTVDNSLNETRATKGIGIQTVTHLLGLQYENRHTIRMVHEDHRFSVTLRLELL